MGGNLMRNDLLKRMIGITFGALLLLGASGQTFAQSSAQASSQSLGDAARAARKNKPQSDTTVRHYDNDNLPTTETLSVVGPEASAQPATAQEATAQQSSSSSAAAAAAAAAEHKQSADDMQNKLDAQKAKIDSLSHE